jgi:hypothetical protein
MSRDVFIIHAPEDELFASGMVAYLESQGVKGWIRKRDFSTGSGDEERLRDALESSRIYLVVFSAFSNDSRAVQREIQQALESNRLLLPVRVGNVTATGSMELLMRRRYCVNATGQEKESAFAEVLRIIKPFANQQTAKGPSETTISRTLPARGSILRDASQAGIGREPTGPFQAAIKCSRVAELDAPVLVKLIVANQGTQLLELVEIELLGETLADCPKKAVPDLSPGTQARLSFELVPQREGPCVVRALIQGFDCLTKFAYCGCYNFQVSSSGEETIVGSKARVRRETPGDLAEVTRNTMTFSREQEGAKPPTLTLEEGFEPLVLSLDYAHSIDAESVSKARSSLSIPFAFLGNRQEGTLLTLERMDAASELPHQEIRFSARPTFVLGRARDEADFLGWFWPRNEIHDAKTLRISKKQCTFSREGDECRIRNTATASVTSFEEQSLEIKDFIFKQRGTVNLSGSYRVEAIRMSPPPAKPVDISNLESWKGPAQARTSSLTGCVVFRPATAHVLPQLAVWIFSEAAFGTSQANALALDLPGLAEVQGRIHHLHGCFWLENVVGNGAVMVDDQIAKARSIIPIVAGKIIKLAGVRFYPRIQA